MEGIPSAAEVLFQSFSNDIGPITFTAGQLEGRTLRAELAELQKAEVGRKYSRKDRRPLDPPPVAELQLFETTISNNRPTRTNEIELLPDNEISGDGIICQVDLFLLPEQGQTETASRSGGSFSKASSSKGLGSTAASSSNDPFEFFDLEEASSETSSPLPPPRVDDTSAEGDDRIVAIYGDQSITEGSKLMRAIAGTSTMHSNVLEFDGRRRILFVFSDIAVRLEGRFFLRYRAFNVLGTALSDNGVPIPMLAECYGAPFTVYSTNDFPGLLASTELTKVSKIFLYCHEPYSGCLERVCLVDYSAFLTLGFEFTAEIKSVDGGRILRQV